MNTHMHMHTDVATVSVSTETDNSSDTHFLGYFLSFLDNATLSVNSVSP